MKRWMLILFLGLLVTCKIGYGQEILDIEKLLESNDIFKQEDGYEEMVGRLLELSVNPIHINQADFDSLKLLFFLSDSQIDHILAFRKKYGVFLHKSELLLVTGIGKRDLENIKSFITVDDVSDKERLYNENVYSRQEIIARLRTNYPRQEGYRAYSLDDFEKERDYLKKLESRFQGPPFSALLKYKFMLKECFQAGVTLENDAGEAFFSSWRQFGFDFLSAYACLTMKGFVKKIVIGDYRVQWGQGLVAWGGFATGKSSQTVGGEKSGSGFSPSTSTDENLFLRGGALSVRLLKQVTADVFFSVKKIDGNTSQADSLKGKNLVITSLYEDGMHRNYAEVFKRHNVQERATGLSVGWNTDYFKIGVNSLYYDFNPQITPRGLVYQTYNDQANNRFLVSLDYKTGYKGIYLFGETARSECGGMATVNGLRFNIFDASCCMLYRRYEKCYVSRYAMGFGEYSNTSNEEGIYVGVDVSPVNNLKINVYYDWFRFFSARYNATVPASGWETLCEIFYQHSRLEHAFRFKCEDKPENLKTVNSTFKRTAELRYQLNYIYSARWEFRSRVSGSYYKKATVKELGYMMFQDIVYGSLRGTFKAQFRMAYFNTDSYNTRIYAYENNVLYGYSFPAFSDKGWRSYLNFSWQPIRMVTCYLKTGFALYPDKEKLSSGVTAIADNRQFDITFQVRIKF